jgi:hypothetical protein
MRQACYEIARFLSVAAPMMMLVVFLLSLTGLLAPAAATLDLVVLLVVSAAGTGLALWLRSR